MGTTSQGYDIFSQFVYGTGCRCWWASSAGSFATVIAVFVGMISGYAEGTFLDNFLSFFTNLALVVPVLPLMMVIIAYSEVRGLWLMVFVIGITSWAGAARGKRAQIITLRSREFVTAAKFSGERLAADRVQGDHAEHDLPGGRRLHRRRHRRDRGRGGAVVPRLRRSDAVSWGRCCSSPTPTARCVTGLLGLAAGPRSGLALLITSLTFINFGVDLLSNPHLREG